MNDEIKSQALGQVGYKFSYKGTTILIDPYLSHYVEEVEGEAAKRMFPIEKSPEELTNIDYVLITHEHLDHCDPKTLYPISQVSPECKFVGPSSVRNVLGELGISKHRLIPTTPMNHSLSDSIKVKAVPAAHPEVYKDENGNWSYVGYVIQFGDLKLFHGGDTAVHDELIQCLKKENGIDYGFIPVNEINFYRNRDGIIGNMGVRDAIYLCEEVGVKNFVPTHWDMFEGNCVYKEEIELVYGKLSPKCHLVFYPNELCI